MNVAVPFPITTSLLLLVLPAIGWLGWQLSRTLVSARSARLLAPSVTLAVWLVSLHASSYAFRSFSVGLVLGTLLPAALGVVGWFLRARVPHAEPEQEDTAPAPRWWVWGGAMLVMLLIGPATFSWAFHDEINITGHMSIASQMQNGVYPPRHLEMAAFELRYHYGFDTMVAAWGALLRIPVSLAIDLLTMLSWGASWLALCDLGPRLLRHRFGWLIAPLMLLGGGLPVLCEAAYDAPAAIWVAGCVVDRAYVGPPLVSFQFQHPWGLGIPLGLTLLSVSHRRSASAWTAVVSCLLLVSLALTQIVLFACLAPAVPAARALEEAWEHRIDRNVPNPPGAPSRWKRIGIAAVPSLIALALASQLGGMFAEAPSSETMFAFRRGPTPTWWGTLEWDLSTFGLFLPLGVIGVLMLARKRVLLPLIMLLGSMLVLHTVTHTVTWDITKFTVVAQVALVLGTGEVILPLFDRASGWIVRVGVAAVSLVLVHAGLAFCLVFAFFPSTVPKTVLPSAPVQLEPEDAFVVAQLRARARPGDVVYRRRKRVGYGYAQWGGLPQVWVARQSQAFGFPPAAMARRHALLSTWPPQIEAYRDEGVRWLVLDDKDDVLRRHAGQWIARGEARQWTRVGSLEVVEISDKVE